MGRGRGAGSLGFQLKFRCVCERFNLVTLGVGGLLDVGFELTLFAQNFLLLQLDLFLLLNDLHLHFFGLHQLAGLEPLQIIREIGLGFFLVHHRLIHGDVGLIIALCLGDF